MSQIHSPSPPTLAGRLRDLRLQVGATQKDVADAAGLAISSISSYEKGAPISDERLQVILGYIALRRARGRVKVTSLTELTEAERAVQTDLLRELKMLRNDLTPEAETQPDLWTFPPGDPIILVAGALEDAKHPYVENDDPNYTDLLSYADLDALFELHGHIRMRNPASEVRWTRSDRLSSFDQLSRHLVMLGGPGLNERLQQVFAGTGLPIVQRTLEGYLNGEILTVPDREPDLPQFLEAGKPRLVGDVGCFARLINPFNSARTLTWCSGVYSRGVLGAVRMLTDAGLRDQNSRYLAERFADARQFAMLVRVPVVFGEALTPDLQNEEMRLYEWPDQARPS
jgi:transcriptional regulator with XRE-family HTH domain